MIGGAGCSLFLDTGGLDGEPSGGPTDDASTSDTAVRPGDDATSSSDAKTANDSSAPDAADAGFDVMSALVGDWPFDEGSGSVVMDRSGRSHNGTIFGGVWGKDRNDVDGEALVFDGGSTNYVTIAGDPDFDRPANPSFTMCGWARFDEPPDHTIFFSVSYASKDTAYGIELRTPTNLTYWDSNDHVAEATVPDVTGQWHHYGVVVSGSTARVYFDGVRLTQSNANTTPRTATQVHFGRSSFDEYTAGAVDKARYFRVALTDAEMMAEKNR